MTWGIWWWCFLATLQEALAAKIQFFLNILSGDSTREPARSTNITGILGYEITQISKVFKNVYIYIYTYVY